MTCATDLVAGAVRANYSFASQSASVLSAPGAATRPFVLALGLVADALVIAFAVGVWLSVSRKRSLRVMAGLLVATAMLQAIAVAFVPFRIEQPANSASNTMNVALMAPSVAGWFLVIVLGAVAFRNWFRLASIALVVILFIEDFLATAGASLLVADAHPGSLVGLQERSMAYGFYLWLALLALSLLRARANRRHIEAAVDAS